MKLQRVILKGVALFFRMPSFTAQVAVSLKNDIIVTQYNHFINSI